MTASHLLIASTKIFLYLTSSNCALLVLLLIVNSNWELVDLKVVPRIDPNSDVLGVIVAVGVTELVIEGVTVGVMLGVTVLVGLIVLVGVIVLV
jgi:hypothetical protein